MNYLEIIINKIMEDFKKFPHKYVPILPELYLILEAINCHEYIEKY